ncbi:MAG: hypothetical protein R2867_42790, partial [Caldilineaceae bacterium]
MAGWWRVVLGIALLVANRFDWQSLRAQDITSPPAPAVTVTASEYLATLQQVEAALTANPSNVTVRQAQQRLSAIDHVTRSDEITIEIQPLLGVGEATLPSVKAAQVRLAVVIAQLTAAQTESAPSSKEQLALLTAIFARPEFVRQDSLWDRFWRWLRSWLPDVPETTGTGNNGWIVSGAGLLGWLVIGIAALLLIYLLSMWLQQLLVGIVGGHAGSRRLTPEGELINAAEARRQAHQLASSGSFREAVRRLYLS